MLFFLSSYNKWLKMKYTTLDAGTHDDIDMHVLIYVIDIITPVFVKQY